MKPPPELEPHEVISAYVTTQQFILEIILANHLRAMAAADADEFVAAVKRAARSVSTTDAAASLAAARFTADLVSKTMDDALARARED